MLEKAVGGSLLEQQLLKYKWHRAGSLCGYREHNGQRTDGLQRLTGPGP